MKLYVYCVYAPPMRFTKTVSGVFGAPVRELTVDDVSLLVSDCESVPTLRDNVQLIRENAQTHAAVVRSVLEQTTPLPFRFGALATEPQLRSYLSTHKSELIKRLEHVRGCVEMDLKIIWPDPESSVARSEPDNVVGGPGTAFLQEKRQALLGDERVATQRAELSDVFRRELGNLIRDEATEIRPAEAGPLFTVFHLIEKQCIQQYREKLTEVLETRQELHFMISGPWPPYGFANMELEFKSQFGVS